jgi:hypothetical protein
MRSFPRLDILPHAQRRLWSQMAKVSDEYFVLYGGTAIALYLGGVGRRIYSKREDQIKNAQRPLMAAPGENIRAHQ